LNKAAIDDPAAASKVLSISSFVSKAEKSFSVMFGFLLLTTTLISFGKASAFDGAFYSSISSFYSSLGASFLSTAFFYQSKKPAGGPFGFIAGAF